MATYNYVTLTPEDLHAIDSLDKLFAASVLPVKRFEDIEKISEKTGRLNRRTAEAQAASAVRAAAIGGGVELKGSRKASQMLAMKLQRDGYATGICPDGRIVMAVDPNVGDIGSISEWMKIAKQQQIDATNRRAELAGVVEPKQIEAA